VGGVNSLDWGIGGGGAEKYALLDGMYCTLGLMTVVPRD